MILLHDNNLGTIGVPRGTQKSQFVKHIKLNALERVHFEFWAIRQQVLTKIIIVKNSIFPNFQILFKSICDQDHLYKSYPCFCTFQLTKSHAVRYTNPIMYQEKQKSCDFEK